MHIITKRRLKEFWQIYPDARFGLQTWFVRAKHARWRNFAELRDDYPSADLVGRLTVFNIRGGHYRLICRVEYKRQKVYIRHVLSHEEYDQERWKSDDWF